MGGAGSIFLLALIFAGTSFAACEFSALPVTCPKRLEEDIAAMAAMVTIGIRGNGVSPGKAVSFLIVLPGNVAR
jgi:hypothetical protein